MFLEECGGSHVFAMDIEHIIGGGGKNTFGTHDGATLQGTVSAKGEVILDYPNMLKWSYCRNSGD